MTSGTLVERYPTLSALVQQKAKQSLDDFAAAAQPVADYLSLATSAAWVVRGLPRDVQVADPYGYLATIEKFLASFDNVAAPRKGLWKKLKSTSGSEFLNTIGEMAIALDFRRRGMTFELEKKFAGPTSKDADIVVRHGGVELWADVVSISSDDPPVSGTQAPGQPVPADPVDDEGAYEPSSAFSVGQTEEQISDFLSKKIRNKYQSKFDEAVARGELAGKPLAILVCVFKAQADIVALFMPFINVKAKLRSDLWPQCPALAAVGVFDLRKGENDVLFPVSLLDDGVLTLRPPVPSAT